MFKIKSVRNYYPHLTVIALMLFTLIILSFSYAPIHDQVDTQNPDVPNYLYDDQMQETLKEYQLEVLNNGDIVVYDHNRTVGIIKYHPRCDLQEVINADNE